VGRSCAKVSFELGVIERELRMVRAVNRRRRKQFVRQSLRKKRRVSDAEVVCENSLFGHLHLQYGRQSINQSIVV